ncbi:MAG: permease-like cell division protein FtsX [Desulfuromonadales bacterium]|nr:permease-like cell division protein FtsX [Desulfuromonadales bacterium]
MKIGYSLKRAFRNMKQSPVLSLASICTIAVALALLAFFAIAVLNVQQLTASWGEEIAVVAYLDTTPEEAELKRWLREIEAFPEIAEVSFVSKEQALKLFRDRLGEDAVLLEGLGDNLLPASMEMTFVEKNRDRATVETVVERLRQDRRFEDFQYGQGWLEKLEAFLLLLRVSGTALGGFLVFAALVIVSNTIKLTLYARQDELEVMTMVGATSLFIKLPYLIEGMLQGALGGIVALTISFLAFEVALQESLGSLLLITGIDTIHFLPPNWQLSLIVGGGLIGLLGSLFALRKFVRYDAT